jgi:hypothetical protein
MAEETWNEARLIPTSGINGADEQERRATSSLLAVMASVREFSRTMLQPLGAPAGTVTTFIEVPFVLGEKRIYPDGLVRVTRGQKSWTALVEVKTGTNDLETEQLENYLDVARDNGFDALITISNQIPAIAGQHPTTVDRRKLKTPESLTPPPRLRSSDGKILRRGTSTSVRPTLTIGPRAAPTH